MSDLIDLHIHTTFSDGKTAPVEIINMARQKKLAAISICDHDNIGAYFEIRKLLGSGDPELIPGVELSAGKSGEDIHILGYYFDPESESFNNAILEFQEIRNQRGAKMLKKLSDLGFDVPMDLVREMAGKSAIGRPHVAEAMYRVGAVRHYNQAFDKYIGLDGPAYVPKMNLTPQDAIKLIHDAGGIAVLAHPGISNVARFIDEFVDYGLDGIEVYHPSHDKSMRKTMKKKAKEKKLLMTGGSDYHGREDHHGLIGSQPVPIEYLLMIKEKTNLK